jgi:P27 family predicted phage terminase small subunit
LKNSLAPKPPSRLSAEAKGWWRKLTDGYSIRDEAGLLLLATGLEAFDRMREAQAAIAKDGVTFRDRFGQVRVNPATTIERDSRAGMLAALKALNLDLEPLHERSGRPSGSR